VLPRNPSLIAPPAEGVEQSPYAPVWRGLALLCGALLLPTLVFFTLGLLGVSIDRRLHAPIDVALALLPFGLWLLFAYLPEQRADAPRPGLENIFIITALVASGVSVPIIDNAFQIDRWLPLADLATRLVGFTVTIGVTQELSKYLVLRALAWENRLRVRMDAVAYAAAAAIGYATATLILDALGSTPTPTAAAFSTFSTVALNLSPSFLIAYGLGEARLGNPTPFLLLIVFALAALIFGVARTLAGALTNASLSLTNSTPNPIFGLAVAAALLLLVGVAVALLISTAERREFQQRTRK
jgi:hypothetical protein